MNRGAATNLLLANPGYVLRKASKVGAPQAKNGDTDKKWRGEDEIVRTTAFDFFGVAGFRLTRAKRWIIFAIVDPIPSDTKYLRNRQFLPCFLMTTLRRASVAVCFSVLVMDSSFAEHQAVPGTTRVARWKDDYGAAYVLMFDDSDPTHVTVAIPMLQKRKLIGTFYLNPGKGEYKPFQEKWEKEIPSTGMVYGNHTWTHSGFANMEGAEAEYGKVNEYLYNTFPGKKPRLISFARPGVAPDRWPITGEQYQELLTKYNLADRGDFRDHGSMVHQQTADEMVAVVDKALAVGGMEYIVFHALAEPGKGTIATPIAIFEDFLNKLELRRDRVWITDHISAYKYQKEREGATVQTVESANQQIRVNLSSTADPQLYDYPLTLVTAVPPGWKSCKIAQAGNSATAAVVNGTVQYEAIPGAGEILIQPAS